MRVSALLLVEVATVVSLTAIGVTGPETKVTPVFVKTIPPGYRDWKLVSVAHEEGELHDIRAILGNDLAVKAFRAGKLPFPDGSIIARLAWHYEPSQENNKVFGREQSFVAGAPKNGLQFMVKDSKRYAATGGWGYAEFSVDDHTSSDDKKLETCFPCHKAVADRDYVFTRYSP